MSNDDEQFDNELTIKLTGIFETALELVKGYVAEGKLNCSTNVSFAGLTDAEDLAVRLSGDGRGHFNIALSRHFAANRDEKLEKTFVRYVATTNVDGTFKTYDAARASLRGLPFERHYDVTYQNDYLLSDVKSRYSGVICDKCGRSFRYDPTDAIFAQTNRFVCRCGGSLVAIVDGVKRFASNTIERYVNLNYTKVDQVTIDLRDFNQFEPMIRDEVTRRLAGVTRPTARQLQPIIKSLVEDAADDVVRAFDEVYRPVCEAIYRQLSDDEQAYIVATTGRPIAPEPPPADPVYGDRPRRRRPTVGLVPTGPLPEITRDEQLDALFFGALATIASKPTVNEPVVGKPTVDVVQPYVLKLTTVVDLVPDAKLNDIFFANPVVAESERPLIITTDAELNAIFFVADGLLAGDQPPVSHDSPVTVEVVRATDEQLNAWFFG